MWVVRRGSATSTQPMVDVSGMAARAFSIAATRSGDRAKLRPASSSPRRPRRPSSASERSTCPKDCTVRGPGGCGAEGRGDNDGADERTGGSPEALTDERGGAPGDAWGGRGPEARGPGASCGATPASVACGAGARGAVRWVGAVMTGRFSTGKESVATSTWSVAPSPTWPGGGGSGRAFAVSPARRVFVKSSTACQRFVGSFSSAFSTASDSACRPASCGRCASRGRGRSLMCIINRAPMASARKGGRPTSTSYATQPSA